jgi:hypothetical protein
MSNDVIIPLLLVAGLLNVFGTVTVAINYANGVRVGRLISDQLAAEERARETDPVKIALEYTFAGELNIQPLADRLSELRVRVATFLKPQPLLIAGILCYVAAAILDTAAGVGALLR